ncbi:MAG: hypothetical protein HYR88_10885, partial [Verrucomicrobia bacterium]|nr:hypothetical protein [Verrucomicrobiota bacterium]
MRVLCLLVCLLVARWALRPAAAFAAEARLRTLGGEQVDGVIRWESNGVVVIDPKLSRIRHVPFSTILRFESEPSEDPSTTTPPATSEPEMMNELPFPWESGVIGAPGELGRASWRDGVFRIETQDAQLGGVKESGRLIFEPIRGDREILVRMNPLRSTQDEARSGICFRSSVDAASPGVFWGSTGSREDVFEWRSASGALMVKSAFDPIPGHRWFKLKRQGDTFSAFRSRDGLRWLLACRTNVPLSRDALVGLVAATPSTSRPMVSTFEHARHAQRMRGAYGVRVELVSGSTLECAELEYDGEA